MVNVPSDLGERIVSATRMAVTAHWQLVLGQQQIEIHNRQHESQGGTGESLATDGLLSTATLGGAGTLPRRPSRLSRFIRRSRR